MFGETVPAFGLGIFCARMRPSSLPTGAIMSGVATATSNSVKPALTLVDQVLIADDVGAGLLRGLGVVALGERDRRAPCGPCRAAS